MKVTWIGQAGLLFETSDMKIIIDPYFSDSCEKQNAKLARKVPVKTELTKLKPDIVVLTHNHLDHTDPETLPYFINGKTHVKVILSENAHDFVKKLGGPTNDYIIFKTGTEWSEKNVHLSAVPAYHSENSAFGVIIEAEGLKYYVTGDTLYNKNIFDCLPDDLYAVFLPINGVGNNMNMIDAARFAKMCGAKYAVPMHFGMFDEINPNSFTAENKVIPQLYKEIRF